MRGADIDRMPAKCRSTTEVEEVKESTRTKRNLAAKLRRQKRKAATKPVSEGTGLHEKSVKQLEGACKRIQKQSRRNFNTGLKVSISVSSRLLQESKNEDLLAREKAFASERLRESEQLFGRAIERLDYIKALSGGKVEDRNHRELYYKTIVRRESYLKK